jgi:hypothetical protein
MSALTAAFGALRNWIGGRPGPVTTRLSISRSELRDVAAHAWGRQWMPDELISDLDGRRVGAGSAAALPRQ